MCVSKHVHGTRQGTVNVIHGLDKLLEVSFAPFIGGLKASPDAHQDGILIAKIVADESGLRRQQQHLLVRVSRLGRKLVGTQHMIHGGQGALGNE